MYLVAATIKTAIKQSKNPMLRSWTLISNFEINFISVRNGIQWKFNGNQTQEAAFYERLPQTVPIAWREVLLNEQGAIN